MLVARSPIALLAVFVFHMSCQKAPTSSPHSANSTSDSDDGGPDNPDSDTGKDGDLAPYLFSLQEAQAITTLVEPYQRPQQPDTPPSGKVSTGYTQLRSFLAGFANKAFALPNLKPGRTFKVTIMEGEVPDASADGYQNIYINTAFIKIAKELSFLELLCHETAHSAMNHHAKEEMHRPADEQTAALDRFYGDVETYQNQAYKSGVYTHNRAEYLRLKQQWDQLAPALSNPRKRQESEADVVGAMICAQMGLTASDYLAGFKQGIEGSAPQDSDPTQIPDQERITKSQDEIESFIFEYLFPLDMHPTNAERSKQLERVMPAVQERMDSTQSLAAEWKAELAREKTFFSLMGEPNASELAKNHVVSLTTSSGLSIKIMKDRGCKHGRIHR